MGTHVNYLAGQGGSSIAALSGPRIKSTINTIENSADERQGDLCWAAIKDARDVTVEDKLLIALTYKYMFHKRPLDFLHFSLSINSEGLGDLRKLKSLYKNANSTIERLNVIERVSQQDISSFIVTIMKSDIIKITRDEVICIFKKVYSGREPSSKAMSMLNLTEDFEEEDSLPFWRKESLKLYNTLNSVLNGICVDEKCKTFIKDLKENQLRLKQLLEGSSVDLGLDEDVLWSSWLECIAHSFSNPDYVHMKGLNYSLFKNMANRAMAIKESSGI
uniref:Matrix protein n=1 Tax=Neuropteran orthomyxo-related virus OKIAV210 TaxID=2792561 RepID=A0A7T0Q5S7_9ORTO|nr:matrix protein [Neuropteran orthomyxo-related virus OKIAV210]